MEKVKGLSQKFEHDDIKWITPVEIPNYDLCPADGEILKTIKESSNKRISKRME